MEFFSVASLLRASESFTQFSSRISLAKLPRRYFAATPSHGPGIPRGFRPKAQGCAAVAPKRRYGAPRRRKARATLGHRPTNIPNRNAVEAHPFPPARLTSATTPLALIRFPNTHPS